MSESTALVTSAWRTTLLEWWESPETKKARRVIWHVARAGKKFLIGTGNAAWVMGTTMLVMVMPLAFEIERDESLALEMPGGAPRPM